MRRMVLLVLGLAALLLAACGGGERAPAAPAPAANDEGAPSLTVYRSPT